MDEALLWWLSIDPKVPCTSVYSPSDGIVGWNGCVGTEAGYHRNIEVDNVSHWGMVHKPEVRRVIARVLAEPRRTNLIRHWAPPRHHPCRSSARLPTLAGPGFPSDEIVSSGRLCL
jgi:hypothetical protein